MSGARAVPGEWSGRDDLPHQPMPFAPQETFIPDRAPGTKGHAVLRAGVEGASAGILTQRLQQRMHEHDPDSGDTTWNRMAPPAERAERAGSSEPSLRESLSAAASLDYGSDK
jgi:hypothetical protein